MQIRVTLRKHAYSNMLKISPPKTENKNSDIFHISVQKKDCEYSLQPPRRGGSNEHPQCMFFLAEIMYTSVNPSFTPLKTQVLLYKSSVLRGSKLYRYVFVMK